MYITCVDDSKRPEVIPEDKWLVKDEIYLAIGICKETGGVILEEINLTEYGDKYKAFNKKRFRRSKPEEVEAFRVVRKLLNELNINVK